MNHEVQTVRAARSVSQIQVRIDGLLYTFAVSRGGVLRLESAPEGASYGQTSRAWDVARLRLWKLGNHE